MPSPPRSAATDRRARVPADPTDRSRVLVTALVAWIVPGGGHALQGELGKAAALFAALVAMFVIGLAAGGRLFPFEPADPLVFLEAVAEWCIGLPRLVAGLGSMGQGNVEGAAYEYGNTFLIVSGLLNALVILDAVDIATGRKVRR